MTKWEACYWPGVMVLFGVLGTAVTVPIPQVSGTVSMLFLVVAALGVIGTKLGIIQWELAQARLDRRAKNSTPGVDKAENPR